ncbi:MAG: LLM class F420-dependent oxidoreductase [Myxococcota bacterium]|nr:LLM class F420-dependent oxidoreductase [Myxococcota bacterium]
MDGIRIGIGVGDGGVAGSFESILQRYRAAEEAGFHTAWTANIFGEDALTLLALAGRETERIELGSAVVPTFSRHPFYMAQQALTTQRATGGRFLCGLGPSHKIVIENMLGLSYDKPARHVREYVSVMRQLFDTGRVEFQGDTYGVNGTLTGSSCEAPPLLIGALGPLMRRIAGQLCDGTITWMTGPRTLGDAIGPDVRKAASEAGRGEPRIVAGFPVCLTDDAAGARESANKEFAIYGTLPSYRAMLDAEGAEGPGDIALIGDESQLEASLRELAAAGVTDFNGAIMPHGDDRQASMQRTWDFLSSVSKA